MPLVRFPKRMSPMPAGSLNQRNTNAPSAHALRSW
jgi:hypothetical protein